MILTDARLLFFPVKSLKGVFAWVTCPMVLERFKRDILAFAISFPFLNEISSFSSLVGTVPEESELLVSSKVILEEFAFEVRERASTGKMANLFASAVFGDSSYAFWKDKLSRSLIVLPDGDFGEFVRTSTEVVTRTRIDSVKGTVQKGGLWTEEYLPQDTIMYAVAAFTRARVADETQEAGGVKTQEIGAQKMAQFFSNNLPRFIQVGGNQTVGKGFVRLALYKEGEVHGNDREKA
jgi:CRISPR-associated protein Cmr4